MILITQRMQAIYPQSATRRILSIILVLIATLGLVSSKNLSSPKQTIVWRLNDTTSIGGFKPTVLGSPQIVHDKTGTALFFDGIGDGLIFPTNPIEDWKSFTIEMLFKPAADGPVAPRLIHCQDDEGNRFTIEIRVTPKGQWYLDTFLKNGKTNKGLTLNDSANLHSCDKWYWAALVYDGKQMTHYVNAVKEMGGAVDFSSMNAGQTAVGVRLNKVDWFKGWIKELRFHSAALNRKALQRFK